MKEGYRPEFHSPSALRTSCIIRASLRHIPFRDSRPGGIGSALKERSRADPNRGSRLLQQNLFGSKETKGSLQPGGWRPIIDLSRLNKFLKIPHFRMKTTRFICQAVRPADWAVSLDLKDAYLHIPIHRDYRNLLRFCWRNRTFQFKVLPFGLATAPRVFSRVVASLAAICHWKHIILHTYLDDGLLRSQCSQQLASLRHVSFSSSRNP